MSRARCLPVLPAPLVLQSPAIATGAGTSTRPTAFISLTKSVTSLLGLRQVHFVFLGTAVANSATVRGDSSNFQISVPVPLKL